MRAVLYTNDMEPLVIIDLHYSFKKCFDMGYIRVPIPNKDNYMLLDHDGASPPKDAYFHMVTIRV